MAIKIQLRDNFIPIELGDLKYKYYTTDEALENLYTALPKVQESFSKYQVQLESEGDEEQNFDTVNGMLKEAYSILLGNKAFDEIYKQCGSAFIMTQYFFEIAEGINGEMEKRGLAHQVEKAKKKARKNK